MHAPERKAPALHAAPELMQGSGELDSDQAGMRRHTTRSCVCMHADLQSEVAAVCYDVNVLGTKGPRKMTAIVPAIDADSGRPVTRAPSIHADNSIIERCCCASKHGAVILLTTGIQPCFCTNRIPAILQRVPVSSVCKYVMAGLFFFFSF